MYPNLTLTIENYRPKLTYSPSDSESRELISNEENISEILQTILEKLGLNNEVKNDEFIFENIANLASEGDETIALEFPELDSSLNTFYLEESLNSFLDDLKKDADNFNDYKDITPEVLEELQRNQNLDLLASLLDYMYYILIRKTIETARNLDVNSVVLKDDAKNLRLRSKMISELGNNDINLEFVE